VELARAYLELMQLRMPDRLQYAVEVDPATLPLRCPPMTVLTLVENAVRHGIDPAEDGGSIRITLRREGDTCRLQVDDTGLGFGSAGDGLGSGLSSLRERLQLAFGDAASLRLTENTPRGVCAEVRFPAQPMGPA
jgi:sensor histidine kinase YesM